LFESIESNGTGWKNLMLGNQKNGIAAMGFEFVAKYILYGVTEKIAEWYLHWADSSSR